MAEHRGAARERARDVARDEGRGERRRETLGDVEHDHRQRVAGTERPPDVRPTDVAAADGANVDAAGRPNDPVSEREAAGEIADEDEDESLDCYFKGTWYFDTQSFTVAQSRLLKKASM